jgi:hypothetical protein
MIIQAVSRDIQPQVTDGNGTKIPLELSYVANDQMERKGEWPC